MYFIVLLQGLRPEKMALKDQTKEAKRGKRLGELKYGSIVF